MKEYDRLLGKHKMYIFENDPEVMPMVEESARECENDRIKLKFGDVFDCATQVHRNTKRVYIDLDLCKTFAILMQNGLGEQIERLAEKAARFTQAWGDIHFLFEREQGFGRRNRGNYQEALGTLRKAPGANELCHLQGRCPNGDHVVSVAIDTDRHTHTHTSV